MRKAPYILFALFALALGCTTAPEAAAESGAEADKPKDALATEDVTTDPVATEAGTGKPDEAPKTESKKNLLTSVSSYKAAQRVAAEKGGFVLIEFEAEWCGPCQVLKKEAWTDQGVANLMKDAVVVHIDIDKPENQALVEKHKVTSIPSLWFETADGKAFGNILGYVDVPWIKGKIQEAIKNRK